MRGLQIHRQLFHIILLMALPLMGMSLLGFPAVPHVSGAVQVQEFVPAAPQGFGDRQNSWAWSMAWWRGHLYVGTNRSFQCAEAAATHRIFPNIFPYPPYDPDLECAPWPEHLQLQAEIWRWSPATDSWERVFQSPNDVPIPGAPDKYVARDIGFRGMTVFTEHDGTEALYVTGVGPSFIWPDVPPPRILRSTDGIQFEAVPQERGTTLGDFPYSSLRNPISFNGRLYVVGGRSAGSGVLLEAEFPEKGGDNFRIVSHPDQTVSSVAAFNGYLYVGLRDRSAGYSVVKTTATGEPPYVYQPVVLRGGNMVTQPNAEAIYMTVFNGHLYVGGDGTRGGYQGLEGAADLIRIHADDTWDLLVGEPRTTAAGWKTPLSGYKAGFGNPFNGHMWRLQEHNGYLYVGTFDSSTLLKDDPVNEPVVRHEMGFDLFRSADGIHFTPITTTGFGDKFSFGIRTMESTPYGLFLGTTNNHYGLQIWRSTDSGAIPSVRVFLPRVE